MDIFYHTARQLPLFPSKVCSRCGVEKPVEKFPKSPTCKDGYRTYCTHCQNIQSSKFHRENRAKNPEQIKRARQKYSATHVEQERARWRRYNTTHVEKQHASQHEYYAKNVEYFRAKDRAWRQANPHQRREKGRRRFARKLHATVETVNYKRILERDGYWCYICEQGILPHHKLHFDHVIPLARDGAHSEKNIKPTHQQCNNRKKDRLLSEMTAFQRRGVE